MRGQKKEVKTVTVVGNEMQEGKKQHLVKNKKYEVTEEIAKALVKNGQASKS